MKIAITGARGTVGREVVKLCAEQGHATVQINRSETEPDGTTPDTEMRTADVAGDYDATLEAFRGCDAVVHLAAIPDPVGKADHVGVVAEWDGVKKKVRAWEQGRESKKVKQESFKLEDLRSGEVKIWRVMPRSWVGWDSPN